MDGYRTAFHLIAKLMKLKRHKEGLMQMQMVLEALRLKVVEVKFLLWDVH
jgi:hypothetical protein